MALYCFYSLVICLILLKIIYYLDSPMMICVAVVCSFSWLNCIPAHGYTTFRCFQVLAFITKMVSIDLYVSPDTHVQGFLQGMQLEEKLLGYHVCPCLLYLLGGGKTFPTRLPQFTLPLALFGSFNCCASLPTLSIARLLNLRVCRECVTVFHCFISCY